MMPAPRMAANLSHANKRALAARVREHVLRMAAGGGCFVGAALSCVDLLVHLYTDVLHVDPREVSNPLRDYLLFSKGHGVPALYGTLAELGFFPRERLARYLRPDDVLYWHPNRAVAGVEFHAGSLGHLLSIGVGIALDVKIRQGGSRVFVVLGDGELDEGSIWEALLVASAHALDRLVLVVDRNGLQANERTEDLIPLEPLRSKLETFGCAVRSTDGHDFAALDAAFSGLPVAHGRPTAIIAHTVRGKGVASLEGRADRWFASVPADDVERLLVELRRGESARAVPQGNAIP
jgi:transketolase